MKIPAKGLGKDELFEKLATFRAHDMPWRDGRTFAYVYDPGPEAESVIHRAYTMYLGENALDPTVFPSTLVLENDVVSIAAAHLGGDDDVAGSFTSGGTESILLAVKTARDHAREARGIREPEILVPETAHAAFHKAAHYLDMKLVSVPVDPATFKADVTAMREAIGPNTILLVGSAVSYAHGVVDPIRELGALALEKNLLLHVDACIGGFLLPYFRRLGAPVPDFDFRVPGVTSISMDFHKYAFAAKGASVLLHKNKDLRRHQFYACASWSGYTVINSTVQSTKSAGPLAACWAVLHHFGDEGYLEIARSMLAATRKIVDGIENIPGLRLLARPEMNLVAFTSDEVSVFHVIDEMKARGWFVQPQLGFGSSKENIHLSLNRRALDLADDLLRDLGECVAIARKLPPPGGDLSALRGALASLDLTKLDPPMLGHILREAMAATGIAGASLPDRMAAVSEVLNHLPPPLRERLLVEYMNGLFQSRVDGA